MSQSRSLFSYIVSSESFLNASNRRLKETRRKSSDAKRDDVPALETRTRLPPCAFLRLSARSCTIRNKSFLDAELPRTNEKAGHATHLPTDEAPHRAEGRYRSDGKTASGQRTTQARSLAYPSQQEPRSRSSRGSMFHSIDGSFLSLRPALRSEARIPARR